MWALNLYDGSSKKPKGWWWWWIAGACQFAWHPPRPRLLILPMIHRIKQRWGKWKGTTALAWAVHHVAPVAVHLEERWVRGGRVTMEGGWLAATCVCEVRLPRPLWCAALAATFARCEGRGSGAVHEQMCGACSTSGSGLWIRAVLG
jgi:hypothetical protein